MAVHRLVFPELDSFIVHDVEPTGVKLGTGAYGAVEEILIPGAICAAKKMHDILLQSGTPQEQEIISETFLKECTLLSRLRHPHIVQFLGVCYLPGSRLPLLVMERLFTSLDGLLENKDVVIPFDAKLSFLRDIANGMIFLHGQTPPVIHRDLTARNVLLNAAMVAKIADLGVARIVNLQPGKIAATMTRNPGNVVYMPPEAAEDTARYSAALDMFSYGNLTIFTLTRTFPDLKAATYYDSKSGRVIARTEVERRDEVFMKSYEELGKGHPLVRLSKQCLSNNPTERPTAIQAQQQLARVKSTDGKWEKTKLELIQDVAIAETGKVSKERDIRELNSKVAGCEKRIGDLEKDNLSLQRQNRILQQQVTSQLKRQEEKGQDDSASDERLAVVLKGASERLPGSGNPQVYKLVGHEYNLPGKMLRKVIIGEPSPIRPEKVLMVLGATGAGKSTLINGMINYILGVQWKDDFRFKLITDEAKSQAHLQTSEITAYTIHHMEGSKLPYDITIIDTPGFGDTKGLKRDEEITKQLEEFFSVGGRIGISHLDGIGFVTQSALARLTPTQQYIFDYILSIFGKDVAKNIFIMVTFADGQKPPVMTAIETASIPHSGFFKFNNAALFAEVGDENEDNFDEMFWKMGVNLFKRFFSAFQKAQSVSLRMTKDVLKQRERLLAIHQELEAKIDNRVYEYTVVEEHAELEHLPPGTYAMSCLKCNYTCHYPCTQPNDKNKRSCSAMSGIGNCRNCPNRCHWTGHRSNDFRYVLSTKAVVKIYKPMLEESYAEFHDLIDEAQRRLMKLEEVALKPNPTSTPKPMEYIQSLINSEKKQAREGWKDRVDYLEKTMEQAKLLAVLPDVDNIDQRIAELKSKKGSGWEEKVEKLEEVRRIKAIKLKQSRERDFMYRSSY